MATDILAHLSAADLRRAAEVREEIAALEAELQSILSGSPAPATRKKKKRGKRAAGGAKRGPKPKKKGAKKKAGKKAASKKPAAKKKGGAKRKFSPEAIERIREAQRKRWAKEKSK